MPTVPEFLKMFLWWQCAWSSYKKSCGGKMPTVPNFLQSKCPESATSVYFVVKMFHWFLSSRKKVTAVQMYLEFLSSWNCSSGVNVPCLPENVLEVPTVPEFLKRVTVLERCQKFLSCLNMAEVHEKVSAVETCLKFTSSWKCSCGANTHTVPEFLKMFLLWKCTYRCQVPEKVPVLVMYLKFLDYWKSSTWFLTCKLLWPGFFCYFFHFAEYCVSVKATLSTARTLKEILWTSHRVCRCVLTAQFNAVETSRPQPPVSSTSFSVKES